MRTTSIDVNDNYKFLEGLDVYHSKYTMLYVLAMHTGLRISDLLSIKVREVKGNILNLVERKTKKQRSCDISKLKKIFKDYIKYNGLKSDDFLFPSTETKPYKAVSRVQVYRVFKVIADDCNIQGVIAPHSCRKAFARKLYAETKDIYAVKKALNHSHIGDTIMYLTDLGAIDK